MRSDKGKPRRGIKERFNEKWKLNKKTKCWEWTASLANGYGQLMMIFENGNRPVVAHRVAWQLYRGSIPIGLFVLHKCDNPKCVRPAHLFLGTQKDNIHDMINKDRVSYGEKHYCTKLSFEEVENIRSSQLKTTDIAKIYGISQSYASRLRNYKKRTLEVI